ncbi:xylose isomerase-like protein [Hortaea werneckii]|nr:xylose isomerase-like protein [Hortaea werneckii]KAI7305838.1 xylose isomerase-like protein [Hortaea werneckii]KAI7391642.1 xylose isomerase-like protein [Hortaea werneckii]
MKFFPVITSMSLGRAWVHSLEEKLQRASSAGFGGVELFYEDLEYFARSQLGAQSNEEPVSPTQLVAAAAEIRKLCQALGLVIIGLQPFLSYEGLLDRKEHAARIEKLHVWFDIVDALDVDTIQIPSNFLPESQITSDLDVIVADMVEVAEMGANRSRPIRFAFENLCWGTHIDTWEQAWQIVELVNRPNFGMCLDTFNIAGRVWADPTSADGKATDADAALESSLERLVNTVDISKVFYLQLVDAERLETPLVEGHEYYAEGQPARMSWSRNARCFMYEADRGAYLPVEKVAQTIIHRLGYNGPISMELFSRTMSDPDPSVPLQHATRGIESWKKIVQALALN